MPPGTEVAGYRLVRYVGRGSFGSVYEAVEVRTQRSVALKICSTDNPEARILRQLDHPNIVGFIDKFVDAAGHVTVLEYVSGIPLSRLLEHVRRDTVRKLRVCSVFRRVCESTAAVESPYNEDDQPATDLLHCRERFDKFGCRVVQQMATATTYAHSQDIIHRDIKPENILVGLCGTARLIDFGVGGTDSDTGLVGGTLSYMPECELRRLAGLERELSSAAHGGQSGVFSDLYALGVVLYEVTVGELPYPTVMADHSVVAAAREALPGRHGLVAKLKQDSAVEPGLREIIVNCLTATADGDPRKMSGYSSAQQLTEDLECLLKKRPLRHSCETPVAVISRRWRRCRTGLLTTASFLLAMFLLLLADRHATGVRLAVVQAFLEERSNADGPVPEEIPVDLLRPGWFPDSRKLRLQRAELCHGLGADLLRNGRPEAAQALLERAVSLAPNSGNAWNDLGVALFKRKEYSRAIRAFDSALALSCDHAAVLSNRGAAHAAANELDNARRDFIQALRIDEQNESARTHLRLLDSMAMAPTL